MFILLKLKWSQQFDIFQMILHIGRMYLKEVDLLHNYVKHFQKEHKICWWKIYGKLLSMVVPVDNFTVAIKSRYNKTKYISVLPKIKNFQ